MKINHRVCYWSPAYKSGKSLVMSEMCASQFACIDDISDERKQKAWAYIKENNPELAELMLSGEFKDFKKEAQEIFGAKQVIEI